MLGNDVRESVTVAGPRIVVAPDHVDAAGYVAIREHAAGIAALRSLEPIDRIAPTPLQPVDDRAVVAVLDDARARGQFRPVARVGRERVQRRRQFRLPHRLAVLVGDANE